MITANSFMKREFGKKLIEEYIPRWDLTHVIDTSGAYIPGHGTPTVILFGRNCRSIDGTIRAIMGIRGEPQAPEDPARGLVWSAILAQINQPGSQSDFVSVADTARESFHKHPWSIGGGGAAELKAMLDEAGEVTLESIVEAIGRTSVVGEDDVWIADSASAARRGIACYTIPFGIGEDIRDWAESNSPVVLYPYDSIGGNPVALTDPPLVRYLWPYRTTLSARSVFGKSLANMGRPWYEHLEHYTDKLRTPLAIAFAFVATHNHFVLDRGGKVFNRSAPVIKLPPDASEDDHLALLGLLNSSVACFWMKQVFHTKGGESTGKLMQSEPWSRRLEFDGTKLRQLPVVSRLRDRVIAIARRLDRLAQERAEISPSAVLHGPRGGLRDELAVAKSRSQSILGEMISWQEELDWTLYVAFELAPADQLVPLEDIQPAASADRPFAILLARAAARGEQTLYWFQTMRVSPTTEIPDDKYGRSTQDRILDRLHLIQSSHNLALIEVPDYKRRWNTEPWEEQERRALRGWLLDRLEDPRHWPQVELISCRRLLDRLRLDSEFIQVAELYTSSADFDIAALVTELVELEAVTFLPVLRYKPSGLAKREVWEQTWQLQRREDAGEKVGIIPVPPKFTSADFLSSTFWRLRGKLDVPKERFVSYPGAESDDDRSLVIGWAGWDHLQEARALAALYEQRKRVDGWGGERLAPLLAGLSELVPWLKQWHNEPNPEFEGERLGDYFERLVDGEARSLGLSTDGMRNWRPTKASAMSRAPRRPKKQAEA